MHLRRLLIAMLAFVAMTVAACGDSGSGDSADANSSAAAGTPVNVAVICSCTGSFAHSIGPASKVAQAWSKSVNAAGGINGHPVRLKLYDDAGNPGNSVTKAKAAISDKVDVIINLTTLVSTWIKAADDAGIPVVGGDFFNAVFSKDPNAYPSGQTTNALPYAIISTAKLAKATNLGILYCAESPSCADTVSLMKGVGEELGLPVIHSASISATAANYTSQCVAAKQAGVTALYVSHSASVLEKVAGDCARQDFHPTLIEAGTGFTMRLVDNAVTKNNLWIAFPILPFFVDQPQVQKLNEAVDRYSPGLRTDPQSWTTLAAQVWTGGLLVERGVESSGVSAGQDVSAAAITKGLTSLKDETLDGWAPPLTFTAGKANQVNCWYVGRVQDGKPALVNDGKRSCKDGSTS
ncbi:branched-chain amino acid transport system substrate-binding protein [Parafrankia irregularis]|uniref:Branched-chain amino acid transport system substrate-binding protein n=2 Tax=Parafrankia irregularis TaxID=795642 RepID=A0A0S4QJK0_9ACTN|nr:ABC transporter substrate-binding protein [Parafrankia sp. CH37]MBE3205646.1 ABC transporter substrate-binding protein [Parafrankia sp. CH37]CUU55454.1 branched-chain amino acid transport system substrate-binding protein [Parafrankia irregularis]